VSVHPVAAFRPVAPDTDWEGVRARVMAAVEAAAAATWSDHNAADPGVTLAEAAAFGLADLQYRTDTRDFSSWPLQVRAWEAPDERHWQRNRPRRRHPRNRDRARRRRTRRHREHWRPPPAPAAQPSPPAPGAQRRLSNRSSRRARRQATPSCCWPGHHGRASSRPRTFQRSSP